MRILLLTAALAAMAGCAEAEGRGEPAATPAPAVQAGAEAEAFVRAVYGSYRDDQPWPIDESRLDAVFSPSLAGLIRRDRALSGGELPYLDADPICNCQDFEGLRVLATEVDSDRHGRLLVRARFVNGGEETETTFQMVRGPDGGWRIDDVLNADGPSLGQALEMSNRRIEQGGRALHRD